MTAGYDEMFYDRIRDGIRSSAAVVAPLVHEIVQPSTVIDVGCGEGWWAHAFADLGADVHGIDGAYVRSNVLGLRFAAHDLELPIRVGRTFDLAVCLEVAEHLTAARAASFIDDLTRLAPVVLFSAAIPGQGGTGHLNEQWPAYWVDLFDRQEYRCTGALRWRLWGDDRVENWYRQNLMLAISDETTLTEGLVEALISPLAPMWPVVHPVLFDARKSA